MKKIECVFCRNSAKRSKEHVWPQWLQDTLDARGNIAAWVHRSISGGAVSRRVQNTASILLGHVCADCNNGWMSELEGRAAPLVRRLLDGIVGATLSAPEASLLALWAFKTAIVINASSNYRRIVPENHFTHLYRERRIPRFVTVDAAHFPGNQRLTSLQSQHFIGVVRGDAQAALTEIRDSCYNIVLGVGSVGLRVAHLPMLGHGIVGDFEGKDRTRRLWLGARSVTFDFGGSFTELMEFEMSLAFQHEA